MSERPKVEATARITMGPFSRMASIACFVAVTASCSTPSPVSPEQMIVTLNGVVTEEFGRPFEKVECDKSLEPEIGAEATCTATAAGVQAEFDTAVVGIDGSNVNFEWVFDESSRAILESAVRESVSRTFRHRSRRVQVPRRRSRPGGRHRQLRGDRR